MERLTAAAGIDHAGIAEKPSRDHQTESEWLEAIRSTETYTKFAHAFRTLTGLPMELRAPRVWGLPLNGAENEGPLCAWMARKNASCAACLTALEPLDETDVADTRSTQCPFGLIDTVVPVKLGERVIGYLQTGQVATRSVGEDERNELIEATKDWGETDPSEPLEALAQSRYIEETQYQSALSLLEVFAGQLSDLANRMLIEGTNKEPALISRAKAYIRGHYEEELSLAKVSKAVNASTFYLCKMFKKSTGLHFTDYISRVRIEHARERLANPNLRVSEIAYDVGFQSLTHFNRVFRNVMGQSPTQYRQDSRSTTGEA